MMGNYGSGRARWQEQEVEGIHRELEEMRYCVIFLEQVS